MESLYSAKASELLITIWLVCFLLVFYGIIFRPFLKKAKKACKKRFGREKECSDKGFIGGTGR